MPSMFSRAKTVLFDVPRHGKLAYCLMRDERIPAAPKAVLLAALGVIVSPLDFPAWIPVLGELDMLALGILAVETFVAACPEEIRREHEEALKMKQSIWDRDVRDTVGAARHGVGRLVDRIRSRVRHRDEYQSMSEVGAEDKAFGSITNQDIASALKAQHRVEIDRHKIDLKEPIKTLGEHQVSLKLHRDVSAHVNVIVTQDR